MKDKKNMTLVWIIVVVLAIAVIGYFLFYKVTPSTSTEYTDISPAEAKALMDNNQDLITIDVSPAYDEGHLPGAVNYPVGDGTLDATIPDLDPNAMYLVYCHVMSASVSGAQKLIDAGFTNVYRLEGEYDAWVDAGYSIE